MNISSQGELEAMTAIIFIGVSIIEYVGIMFAMLALFRYPVNYYWPQIVFTSAICSVLSYILSVENDIASAPLIQIVVLILCVWLMFYTPLLWSLVVCASFMIGYAVIQGGIIYFNFWLGLIPAEVDKTGIAIYLIQIFCAVICSLAGYYWQRRRIGFLFVPTNREVPFVWNRTGIWLFVGSVASFSIMGISFVLYAKSNFQWFAILLCILLIVSVGLLVAMRIKNHEYVEKTGNH